MRNSAIADKPRDAFVQTFGVADLLKKHAPPHMCHHAVEREMMEVAAVKL